MPRIVQPLGLVEGSSDMPSGMLVSSSGTVASGRRRRGSSAARRATSPTARAEATSRITTMARGTSTPTKVDMNS